MVAEENNSLVPQTDSNSTELNASAEYRGNKEDEEDVLLTAQRYLNIFHQIHIFKEFRRQQFKQQLLEMPHKIRKVVALLPGGRILLEHIAELMQEAGQKDPALDALLLSISKDDHFSNGSAPAGNAAAPALTAPNAVPALAAPIELGSDFTKALTDSFQSYSQNLKDLSANIQKLALNAPHNAGASGSETPSVDYTKALTASFQAYSKDLKDLTSSIRQIAQNNQSSGFVPASGELDGNVAKSLTSSFDTYARNLEDLTESVKKIAANQQTPVAAAPVSVEFGDEVAKSLTSSFDAYTRNLEDLTESIKKIAANQQSPIAATPSSIELSGDFSKALTASFEAYSHNLENLTESIKQIAANNVAQIPASAAQEIALPNLTDSISAVLKENAQQQMSVLKSFGEMLSKTIADSQRELVSSIKNSSQNSMIVGKFMQVPVENAASEQPQAVAYTQTSDKDVPIIENKAKETNYLTADKAENTLNTRPDFASSKEKVPSTPVTSTPKAIKEEKNIKENKEAKSETKAKPKNVSAPETIEKINQNSGKNAAKENAPQNKPENKNKTPDKEDKSKPKEPKVSPNEIDIGLFQADDDSDRSFLNNELNDNEIDINDVFAQVASSLRSDTPLSEVAEDDTEAQTNDFTQAFDDDTDTKLADDNFADDFSSSTPQDEDPQTLDPLAQIRDAFSSDNQISLDDFNDVTPVSLSPSDDFQDAFTDSFANQNNWNDTNANNATATDNNDAWEYVDENGNPIEPSADEEWEYEYVDENGNPIESENNATEYEYVDENGNPIELSDDNTEYEYVDENGNPIEPSDDEEWEYEYVDEDGNPIKG